jgi:hypothetical protein
MINKSLLLATLLLAAGHADAASQKVFRCGPDGRVFSQTPCKDGYEVNADDKRSVEQRKAADDNVKREEKMVEKMTREREAREAAGAKQGASIIRDSSLAKPVAPAASAAAAKKKRSVRKPA